MIIVNSVCFVLLEIIILRYPKNEVPWKSWLDPRFPRNSILKWILKWLPLDRGYFKLCFRKGKSILIISCHTSLLTRNFVSFFVSSHICIVMHLILFKTSRVSVLLINNPSKKRWHGNFGSILGFPVTPSKSEI